MQSSKIVILDAYPLNAGDLSWNEIASLGELIVYESCPDDPAEIIRRCAGAEIVMTNRVSLSGEIIHALPELRLIVM